MKNSKLKPEIVETEIRKGRKRVTVSGDFADIFSADSRADEAFIEQAFHELLMCVTDIAETKN